MRRSTFDITIRVIGVAKGYIAATELGGVAIKSPYVDEPDEAVRQLFARIVNKHDDSPLALALAMENTDLAAQMAADDDAAGEIERPGASAAPSRSGGACN